MLRCSRKSFLAITSSHHSEMETKVAVCVPMWDESQAWNMVQVVAIKGHSLHR
jgi:hypothetical protein